MKQIEENKNHDALDLMKVFLAAAVVAYHVVSDGPLSLMVFCHLTIPIFFIISSYFFFSKINRMQGDRMTENRALIGFLWRLLRLYLCWEIVQLPITLKQWTSRGYGLWEGIWRFVINFFLGSTFFASWYLMALMIGTLLIFFMSRKLKNRALILISMLCYFFCIACSSYSNLLHPRYQFFYPPTSFLCSMIWIVFGKMIAEGNPLSLRFRGLKKKSKLLLTAFALGLFFAEFRICRKMGWLRGIDVFLGFLPACPMIFMYVLDLPHRIRHARTMRTISTVSYCFHGTAFALVISFGNRIGVNLEVLPYDLAAYAAVLILCFITAACIIKLKKRRGFEWLEWFC